MLKYTSFHNNRATREELLEEALMFANSVYMTNDYVVLNISESYGYNNGLEWIITVFYKTLEGEND